MLDKFGVNYPFLAFHIFHFLILGGILALMVYVPYQLIQTRRMKDLQSEEILDRLEAIEEKLES